MSLEEKFGRKLAISQVFRPGAPVNKLMLFAGREMQIQTIFNVISHAGQHAIIYGERGVGKTSLSNVLSDVFKAREASSWRYVRVNCDGQDTFQSLWEKVFREIQITYKVTSPGFLSETTEKQTSTLNMISDSLQPEEIRYWFQRLGGLNIIVFDEIDRIVDKRVTTLLADTIKSLSDHALDTKLIIVGVADSVDQLITEHQSIERALVQVLMPRMSTAELVEILDKGFDNLDMTIDDDAKKRIAILSQGLPHYTHLLGLYSAQEANEQDRTRVTINDVQAAIKRAVETTQQSIISAYHKAVTSPRKTVYAPVLLACALAPKDALGYFTAADVRGPLTRILDKPYDIPAFSRHLNDFCEERRGPTLQKLGTARRFRFRFINPLLQSYVIMHGIARGLEEKILSLLKADTSNG